MKCPICEGEGRLLVDRIDYYEIWSDCNACNGKGKVSIFWMIEYWFMNTKIAAWLYDL